MSFGGKNPLPTTYSYQIVNTYPHDPEAFTQGLIYHQGSLYEGTGLYGYSSLRQVELTTGEVLKIQNLPENYFGEGITLWQDQLIQLTWQSQKGFVYDLETFTLIEEFTYNTEGWGLTHDQEHLIMSDGSDTLYYLNPLNFQVVDTISVRMGQLPVVNLNELEYINGEIWANIWGSDCVARISPDTGQVLSWVNFENLQPTSTFSNPNAVLNGIAYDTDNQRIFVTGKLWSSLYEVEVISQHSETVCYQDNLIEGTNQSDRLTGNLEANHLLGFDGNDTLEGMAGNDFLDGGLRNDLLIGGDGDDNLIGKAGNDTLDGGQGDDTMRGSDGNDYYLTDSIADIVENEKSNSTVNGIDTIESSVNIELSLQGQNVENLILNNRRFIAGIGNPLNNLIEGSNSKNRISGGKGDDTLKGGGKEDRLLGNYGNDILEGGEGSDRFEFESIDARFGIDQIVDFNPEADLIIASQKGFPGNLQLGVISPDLLLTVESLEDVDTNFSQGFVYATSDGSLAYLNDSYLRQFATLNNRPILISDNIEII